MFPWYYGFYFESYDIDNTLLLVTVDRLDFNADPFQVADFCRDVLER